jgi:hypothetical protein
MKLNNLIVLVLVLFTSLSSTGQQERIIDLEIVISSPDSGHYFISPGLDTVEYYMVNHGPDTIYPSDGYLTSVKLANVIINPKVDYVGIVILPGDSVKFKQQLVLEYYNHRPSVDFCIETYVYASDRSKIFREKDSVEMYANNKSCTKVGHNRVELGTEDLIEISDISVYPNPSYGAITLASSQIILSYDIINTQGDIISSEKEVHLKEVDTDIFGLSSGLYFIRIQTLRGYVTRKLVVLE